MLIEIYKIAETASSWRDAGGAPEDWAVADPLSMLLFNPLHLPRLGNLKIDIWNQICPFILSSTEIMRTLKARKVSRRRCAHPPTTSSNASPRAASAVPKRRACPCRYYYYCYFHPWVTRFQVCRRRLIRSNYHSISKSHRQPIHVGFHSVWKYGQWRLLQHN